MSAKKRSAFGQVAEDADRPLRPQSASEPTPRANPKRRPRRPSQADSAADTGTEQPTANELARAKAGVAQPAPPTTAKEKRARRNQRQAARRRNVAAINVEVTPEQKADLIAQAAERGISVAELVRRRLFGEPS